MSDAEMRLVLGSDPEEQLSGSADCNQWNAFLEGLVSCYACPPSDIVSECLCCGRDAGLEIFYLHVEAGQPPGLDINTPHPQFCGLMFTGTCDGNGNCGHQVFTGVDCADVVEYWNQS